MYFSKIISTGAYVPEKTVTNDDLSKIVDTNDEWIVSRSGIGNRHFSSDENTSDLASEAAKRILQKINKDPKEIELIVVATVSADYTTPSVACLVQAQLGAENAVAFDINAACSGFVFGLSVADKFIKTGVYKNAIVIGSEVLSKYLDFEDRGTCVLFGDGAAGVYIERAEKGGILAENIGSDGSKGMSLTGGYSQVVNAFNGTKKDGKDFFIKMDGRVIFDFATRKAPKSVMDLLESAGIPKEEVDFILPHQANSRIVEVVSRKLKIPMDKFYMNMFQYGNTSSASIPIALNEMMEKGLIKEGNKIVICGFGAGLTWGSMLIEF
ncbi:MAG TPA: 3-oxoacyl-ACP synthase [Lachnospiraceae bacterium]|nr:3-oxoacyl-ACP synthase [Lachnospiraceae bacterium]